MKRRLSAVLLALGLSMTVFSAGVYAEEAEILEMVTEAPEDFAAEAETEEPVNQQYIDILSTYASVVSSWTEDQVDELANGSDLTTAAIALNWKSVMNELGAFVEVTDAELNAEGTEISGTAVYEKTGDMDVTVTYSINPDTQTATMNWNVDYPMGTLLQQAGLNTIMGLAIVFVVLFFLSFLIGRIHFVTDAIEGKTKKKSVNKAETAKKAAPSVDNMELAAIAGAVAANDCMNDYELVAVITAAIAAMENTSTDSFVVRSIKKENRKNWLRRA